MVIKGLEGTYIFYGMLVAARIFAGVTLFACGILGGFLCDNAVVYIVTDSRNKLFKGSTATLVKAGVNFKTVLLAGGLSGAS